MIDRRKVIQGAALSPLVAAISTPQALSYKQSTPDPAGTTSLIEALPLAEELAIDWAIIRYSAIDVSDLAFTEGVSSAYGGPKGSHIHLSVFRHDVDRRSILEAWEDANDRYSRSISWALELDYSYDRRRQLEGEDPPQPFAEAIRIEGTDSWFGSQVGIGIYSFEPDAIIHTIAVGSIAGDTRVDGVDAADRVARLVATRLSS